MNPEKYVQKSEGLALLFVDNENVGVWTEDALGINLTNFVTSLNYSSSCKVSISIKVIVEPKQRIFCVSG